MTLRHGVQTLRKCREITIPDTPEKYPGRFHDILVSGDLMHMNPYASFSTAPYSLGEDERIAHRPGLVCDEPAAGMNPNETEDLVNTIKYICENFDMTILLIEHDMKFVSGLCDQITVLNFGTVLAEGDTKEALNNPEVIKAYIGG